jgi:hypothetical protein
MSKRNGTWLIGTLTVDERILEEAAHPETLRSRPEIRVLPGPMRDAWIEHNPYVARASPGFIQSVQRIIEFNQKLPRPGSPLQQDGLAVDLAAQSHAAGRRCRRQLLCFRRPPLLPGSIFLRQADGARSVASSDGRGFIEKEHTVLHIAASRNSLEGGTTVETPVNPATAMAPERARLWALIRPSVWSDQREGLTRGHFRTRAASPLAEPQAHAESPSRARAASACDATPRHNP